MSERQAWSAMLGAPAALPTDPFALIATAPAGALCHRLRERLNPTGRTDRSAAELGHWDQHRQAAPVPWTGTWGLFAALSVRVLRDPQAYAAWVDPAIRAAIWPPQWDADPGAAPEGMEEKHLMRWVIFDLPGHALSDGVLQALYPRRPDPDWAGFAGTFATLRTDPALCPALHQRWWTYAKNQPASAHVRRVLRDMASVFHDAPELAQHFPDLVDELRASVRAEGLAQRPATWPSRPRQRS